jgi:hypothetical protein
MWSYGTMKDDVFPKWLRRLENQSANGGHRYPTTEPAIRELN